MLIVLVVANIQKGSYSDSGLEKCVDYGLPVVLGWGPTPPPGSMFCILLVFLGDSNNKLNYIKNMCQGFPVVQSIAVQPQCNTRVSTAVEMKH